MNSDTGLRERKKLQTKHALTESAYKLFQKRGYDKTSIDDIARAANFAPRTFFLHFSSKEDLLFPDEPMLVQSLQKALAERETGITALQTLRLWAKAIVYQKEPGNSPRNTLRRNIIESDKSLQIRQRLNLSVIEEILAAAIASDLQVSAQQAEPKIAASAAVAVFGMLDGLNNHDTRSAAAQAAIDTAIDFLESGLVGMKSNRKV